MTDDLKNYYAPNFLRDNADKIVVWACIIVVAVVARWIPNNAERQEDVQILLPRAVPAVSAPYQPCPKTNKGKWLKAEIAHWRKDGWVIHCDYRGLMTRDEASL